MLLSSEVGSKTTRDNIIITLFLLLIFGCNVILPDKILGRNIYYLSFLFSFLVIIKTKEKLIFKKRSLLLGSGFLLFGLTMYIWSMIFPGLNGSVFLADKNYALVGKYIIFLSIPIFFIENFKLNLSQHKNKILYISIVSFLYLCGRAFFYHYESLSSRLDINSGPTSSAYLFCLQSFLTIYLVSIFSCRFRKTIISIIIAFSVIIILWTETRSVLLIYPIMLLLSGILNNKIGIKKSVLVFIALVLLFSIFFKFISFSAYERIESIQTELSQYKDNNSNTSLGIRLVMWNSALDSIKKHPLGQSADSRYKDMMNYISKHYENNYTAKDSIVYHVHNQLIETLSLQGIIGLIALFFLFFSIIYFFYTCEDLINVMCFLLLPIMSLSMTDVLFIDDRFVALFCIQILIYCLLSVNNKLEN